MKNPNFFIIGAPKCGTTSMAAWLADHPSVFFSPVKEPHYFNFDFAKRTDFFGRKLCSLSKYEKYFFQAKDQHLMVGEGSTNYLYSRTAVPAILQYTKNPRFIVMIRNPVEMAYSLHDQEIFNGNENESNFERAWNLQKVRTYGKEVPKNCTDSQMLLYGPRCCLGKQIKQLYEIVSRDQVLVLNLDEIRKNARHEYLKTLSFLGLKDDNRKDFPVLNTAKKRQFQKFYEIINWGNRMLITGGIHIRLGITAFIDSRTRQQRSRPPLSKEMYHKLYEYFAEDINLLEKLTGWDLSHWKPGI
jgi:hypothetical protein